MRSSARKCSRSSLMRPGAPSLPASPAPSSSSSSLLQYKKAGHALSVASSRRGDTTGGDSLVPRRWCRDGNENCVEAAHRHNRNLTEYAITYKFRDPDWNPILRLECGNPVALELRARHINFHLKHLVCKGHAMYYITHTQHSVLAPRGIAERSHCVAGMGHKNERLMCDITHEGPLDAANPDGPRGVVALSQSWSFATCFMRRPMWQRTRRIGAMQAKMGAFDYELWDPESVHRSSDAETMLLKNHTKEFAGGFNSVGLVSSLQMSRHPFHFVTHFEAPSTAILDALHQLAYLSASHHKLVQDGEGEKLHAIAWMTRTQRPFPVVELDMPFNLQLSRPTVYEGCDTYPSTQVGAPFVDGAPLALSEYFVSQGAPEYIYDDGPSSRPRGWWQQRSMVPYEGHIWTVRDGQVPNLRSLEPMPNPFAPPDERRAAMEKRKRALRVVSPVGSQRVLRRVKKSAAALEKVKH